MQTTVEVIGFSLTFKKTHWPEVYDDDSGGLR